MNEERAVAPSLPPFTVRRSPRARRARIIITPHAGVEVVVPPGIDLDAEAAVRERQGWIRASLADIAEQRAKWTASAASLLPESVEFAATEEQWGVDYAETGASTVRVVPDGDLLRVSGAIADPERCLAALQRWLHSCARDRLLPLLSEEAQRVLAPPARVSVRGQRDRWAGCSRDGHITLNRALLFLREELVRAVIRHELAHLQHPDHSPAFWARLRAIDPEGERHHLQLRAARSAVPGWAERHPRY